MRNWRLETLGRSQYHSITVFIRIHNFIRAVVEMLHFVCLSIASFRQRVQYHASLTPYFAVIGLYLDANVSIIKSRSLDDVCKRELIQQTLQKYCDCCSFEAIQTKRSKMHHYSRMGSKVDFEHRFIGWH